MKELGQATELELADKWIQLDYKVARHKGIIVEASLRLDDIETEMKARGFAMPCTKLWKLARANGLIYDRDGEKDPT